MVLINEIGDYADVQAALRATLKEPPTWQVRPELRNRIISAYTLERTHWLEIENLLSRTGDEAVRNTLSRIYLEEEGHQAVFGSLLNPKASPWDHLVGSEIAFINHVAVLAQIEPEPTTKALYDYLILDHLTHAKALADETRPLGLDQKLADEVAGLPGGRPLEEQFCLTEDLLKEPYAGDADPATKVNVRLVRAAETIIRELIESVNLMGAPGSLVDLARQISTVEAEHQLVINTLLNPEESILEKAFFGELAEVTGLNRLLATEKESGAKEAYEFSLEEDEDHLRYLGGLLVEIEGKNPGELSDSKVFQARPRRTLENYLSAIVQSAGGARLAGKSITEAA